MTFASATEDTMKTLTHARRREIAHYAAINISTSKLEAALGTNLPLA